jgi:hypothetical protein
MAKKLQAQQAVRPGVLIAVAAVGAAAVAFFVVNLLISHKGGSSTPSTASTTVTTPAQQPIPNLTIPTAPPAPPGTGRDPFQPVAGAGATPAPVNTPAPAPTAAPAATAKPEFQSSSTTTTADKAYVAVQSVSPDHKSATIQDGTITYGQAQPGQTLDRGVVVDSIDSAGKVHMHRGAATYTLAAGDRVLM